MFAEKALVSQKISFLQRSRDIAAFIKLRLTILVVISSAIGYAIGATHFSWITFLILCIAGFMITGASNGFNQIIERDLDAQMNRTKNRPVVVGRLSTFQGLLIASISGIVGLLMLYFLINPLSGILGMLALFSYTLLYTPLKRITPLAVFVGAFPGAIPPMLGYVAATGTFDLFAGLLFATQFIWQFPHFWAIAWVLDEDYRKAGFRLLPSPGGKDKTSAFINLVYCLFLIPVTLLPWAFDLTGNFSAIGALVLGIGFCLPAIGLFKDLELSKARLLMFASFFYLPLLQLLYLADVL